MNRNCMPVLIGILAVFDCCIGQTNVTAKLLPQMRTNFVKSAELNKVELNQVLLLAEQNGIQDPAEVDTFAYIPAGGYGISVKSKERVDGRNISYDTIIFGKDGWTELERDKNAKRLGSFSVREPGKYTTLQHIYEFNKQPVRVIIGEGVDTALADKAVPLILSKHVQFQNEEARLEFRLLGTEAPISIRPSQLEKGGYEMDYHTIMRILMFKVEKDEVIITGVASYAI